MLGCAIAWTVPLTVAVGFSTPKTSLWWVGAWLAGMAAFGWVEQRWARVIAAHEERTRLQWLEQEARAVYGRDGGLNGE
jgi:hypothetical protein